jgi:hypothetical protein
LISISVYHLRTNLVKDERGDLPADPHKVLNYWKNYICHLLNVHGAGCIMQTAEPSTRIGKLKRCKLPGADQIPAVIQMGTLHSEIHRLIKLIWTKEELLHQWEDSIVIPIHKNY